MATRQQLLAFKRHTLAGLCFDRAGALAQHIIDTAPDPVGLLYSPMVAGMVVTYMRPFMQGDGLGPLPPEFRQFTDPTLQDTHNQLQESRNKLYAHQDLKDAVTLPTEDGTVPFDMWIEFDGSNRYSLMPGAIEISPTTLPDIVRLCAHQRETITTKIKDGWAALTGGKTYPPGRYDVGTTFP